jgi:hypothetical protein
MRVVNQIIRTPFFLLGAALLALAFAVWVAVATVVLAVRLVLIPVVIPLVFVMNALANDQSRTLDWIKDSKQYPWLDEWHDLWPRLINWWSGNSSR